MSKSNLRLPRINNLQVAGRLTKDPELKYGATGTAFCMFSIAFDTNFKKGDEWVKHSSFINFSSFGKVAELIAKDCVKGSPVIVEARLQLKDYVDRNGEEKKIMNYTAFKIDVLEWNSKEQQDSETKTDSQESDVPF